MAAIPPVRPHTSTAIYKQKEGSRDAWESIGIPAGSIGNPCERAIWYDFRYASSPENIDGRKVRIFERGDIEETRIIEDLESVGVEVTERQARVRAVGGHVRGKIDGQAVGLLEDPETVHLLECKSSKDSLFKILIKKKVKEAKPEHYATMQFYMRERGLTKAFYVCNNKNDETYYTELVEYDEAFTDELIARAKRVITTEEPPARITEKPDYYVCLLCRHKGICHGNAFPRVTCRSCLHSTPELSGDAHWSCAKWHKPLSVPEQLAACESHLFLPAVVPGEQIDADEETETVTYKLNDGRTWVDGEVKC